MNKLREYNIAFRSLKEGTHIFNFKLDSDFFDCFETTKNTEGSVNAIITFRKSSLIMEVKIELSGYVKANCDRCLGNMELEINGNLQLYVKQSEREEGNEDDFIIVKHNDDFIDLSLYIYEAYILNYPIQVIHEEGKCDKAMQETLAEYIIEEEDKPTDPRWDALKKLRE